MFSSANSSDLLINFISVMVVAIVGFVLVKKFLDNDYKLKLLDSKRNAHKDLLPLRLPPPVPNPPYL